MRTAVLNPSLGLKFKGSLRCLVQHKFKNCFVFMLNNVSHAVFIPQALTNIEYVSSLIK